MDKLQGLTFTRNDEDWVTGYVLEPGGLEAGRVQDKRGEALAQAPKQIKIKVLQEDQAPP